jgi:hypothetical protein
MVREMMRVAIYIRVSTEMQVDRYSPEDQERTCRAYAVQRGWQVADIKETIEAQLKWLALVYAAGDIDEATYQRQRAAWRKQLEETGAPILPSAYNPRRAFEVLGNLANLLDGANEAQQRSVLGHIFATLWLAPHRVAAITPTDLYAPMLAAVETLRGKDGDMGCLTGFEPATS